MAQAGGLELLLELFNVFGGFYLDDEIQITESSALTPILPVPVPSPPPSTSIVIAPLHHFHLLSVFSSFFCFWINTCLYNYILFYIVILLVSRINQI